MAQGMVGEQDGDSEATKERFMANGGVETIRGGTEDVGECDRRAGTPVHGSIINATNSDLPSKNTITFKVNRVLRCGPNGEHVMLPQGSEFTLSLDQRVSYGQERQFLCATQLERPASAAHPRGDRKSFPCFPVADIQGRTGMQADVDNHWGSVITGSILSALLGIGPSMAAGEQTGFAPSIAQGMARNVGQNLNQAGQRVVQRELSRKPTLTTEMLEDVVVFFSSNLQMDPWEPVGSGPKIRRVAAW
jgi:type IV secretion system protein VirB10